MYFLYPSLTVDYFQRDQVEIWISSHCISVTHWTVFCMRWDHGTSEPPVCLARPCSISAIIPHTGVFQHENTHCALRRKEKRTFLRSGGSEECLTSGESMHHPSSHALELAPLLPPLPSLYPLSSLHSSWALHFGWTHKACTSGLTSCLPLHAPGIDLCLPNCLLLLLFVFHKNSQVPMTS